MIDSNLNLNSNEAQTFESNVSVSEASQKKLFPTIMGSGW